MGGQLVLIPVAASSTRLIIQRRGLFLLSGKSTPPFSLGNQIRYFSFTKSSFSFSEALIQKQQEGSRSFAAARSSLEPPDLLRLTETARISLTQDEVEEFAPKIQQVVDWFGQLQAVDLQSIEPAIRAEFSLNRVMKKAGTKDVMLVRLKKVEVHLKGSKKVAKQMALISHNECQFGHFWKIFDDTEGSNWRDDFPETFENREAMIAAVPNYEEPYIKVPKVLNKE